MKAAQIVSALIGENDITPEEVAAVTPGLLSNFEFIGLNAIGLFTVNRCEGGRCQYIGIIWHDEEDQMWSAERVAPCRGFKNDWVPKTVDSPARYTREQAARDLWRIFSSKS